jgi:uncharacterized membrane protein YdjX (TVP38/TMEM64 family)
MPDISASQLRHPVNHRPRQGIAWWRPLLLGMLLVTIAIITFTSDVRGILESIHDVVMQLGPWGPVVFLAIFVVWVVLALPGSWLSAMAGVLWGTIFGFAIAMMGAIVGAAACFLIARYFARKPFQHLARRSRRFARLDRLTREHGAIIVILVRLIPLFPYNITNYAFGLTAVGFWTYLLWSFVCMIPGTLFLVAGADALAQAVQKGELPTMLVAVALASLGVLGILIVLARRQLQQREDAMQDEQAG